MIKEPTRVTKTTQTLIDVILTNSLHCDSSSSGIMRCGISDHDLIYVTRKLKKPFKKQIEIKHTRNFKNINIDETKSMITEAPWWALKLTEDVDRNFEIYCEILKIIMNTHIPLKKMRVHTSKPIWMTKDYCRLVDAVTSCKTTATVTNRDEDWTAFKQMRNKCENLKRKLKLQSFNTHINDSNNQSKSAWKVFNREIGKSKPNTTIKSIIFNSKNHENEVDVANAFCKYFTTPITPCSNTISEFDDQHDDNPNNDYELDLKPITIEEVQKSIKYLKVNKPVGSDGIPAKFYKIFSEELSPILVYLFNLSLKNGQVPSILKKSYIKCLYKGKGSRVLCTNYRPISIISSTAKLFENIMYQRLSNFLEDTHQLSDSQHGYRKNRSTQSAVLQITNHLRMNGDNKQYTGLVFIDFKKAFDCLNHRLLLKKLKKLGVKTANLKWYQSYFTNRNISVQNGQAISTPHPLTEGTPQGSSLSGLIFSIYINEISDILENCKAIFYADDLVLYCSFDSVHEIQRVLQLNIDKLINWCKNNSMIINVEKTKSMLAHLPRAPIHQLDLIIHKDRIETVSSFRYLGVIIDDQLTWNEQYEAVCESMSTRTYLINRHKSSVSKKWLHIISTGIILSVLDYCLPAWGNLPKHKYARIDSIVYRVIKLILPTREHYPQHKLKLYEKLNWLTVGERYELYCLTFMYKNVLHNTSLSESLKEFFVKIPETGRITRNKMCFVLPRMKSEFGKNSYFYQTIKIWNCLPHQVKCCSSEEAFSLKVRDILLRCRRETFACVDETRIINHFNC